MELPKFVRFIKIMFPFKKKVYIKISKNIVFII